MRKIGLLTTSILISILTSCGKDDSSPTGLVGNWELSELIFETGSSSVSIADKKSTIFTMEFKVDNTLVTEGTNVPKNYTWSYESGILTVSSDGGEQTYMLSEDGSSFQYSAFATDNMSSVSGENRQLVELAASSFNQYQTEYDPSGSLTVYFKFKRL